MSAQLTDRRVVVYLGQNTSQKLTVPGGGVNTTDVLKVEGLRCQFKVHKDNGMKPNTCEVIITNLNKVHRGSVQKRYAPMILQAGYLQTIATIFQGTIRQTDQRRAGPDWNTVVHSGDGEVAHSFATLTKSYSGGTPKSVVLSDLANALGAFELDPVDVQVALPKLQQVPGTFPRGYHASGKVSKMLADILRTAGLEWSVQDNRLQVLDLNGTTPEQSVLISPQTGLIGSPQMACGDGKSPQKNAGALKFQCLLSPTIRPGKKIALQSEGVSGVMRVISVEHRGDSAGGDFTSEIEAMPCNTSIFSQ